MILVCYRIHYKWDPCLKGEALLVQLSPDLDASEGDSMKDSYHSACPEVVSVAGSEGGEFRLSSSLSTPTPAHTVSV